METFIVPKVHCLKCRAPIDRASIEDDSCKPEPGNFSICCSCAHVTVYSENLTLREPNAEERRLIKEDFGIATAIRIVKSLISERN
jgi:hypothetical protein